MSKTRALAAVAVAFLEDPHGKRYGYSLSQKSGVPYPTLPRFLNDALVTDGWEDPNATTEKRPPRRYFELTDKGQLEPAAAVRTVEQRVPRPGWCMVELLKYAAPWQTLLIALVSYTRRTTRGGTN